MGLEGIRKGNYIAINQAAIRNSEETFQKLFQVGPKVCITTANHPGF